MKDVISKLILTAIACFVVLPILALFIFLFAPYLWYPSFDDIDIDRLHKEADYLHALCEVEAVKGVEYTYVKADDKQISYILDLSNRGLRNGKYGLRCSGGVHISMWNNWWVSGSGIYVVREGQELPSYISPFASHLGGRVYRWHDDG